MVLKVLSSLKLKNETSSHANCMTALPLCISQRMSAIQLLVLERKMRGKLHASWSTAYLMDYETLKTRQASQQILYICINYAKQEIKDCWAWDLQI